MWRGAGSKGCGTELFYFRNSRCRHARISLRLIPAHALTRRVGRAGELERGQPVFREVIKGGQIGAGRLSDRSVARVIKRRVRERAL